MASIRALWQEFSSGALVGASSLVFALWIAICAAAPEFIWQGIGIGLGHVSRADLLSALLIGLILAFFVEPLMRRLDDLLHRARDAPPVRNLLFVASLSVVFALVSVSVHHAMTAFVSDHGAGRVGAGSGLAAAIALATAWATVPFAITLAWLSVRSGWLRVPMGSIGAASAAIAGWLFSWSGPEVIATTLPCLVILNLGYRQLTGQARPRALARCAPIVALVGVGWLTIALALDAALAFYHLDRFKLNIAANFWVDVRFYLGWALGLVLAPSPYGSNATEVLRSSSQPAAGERDKRAPSDGRYLE